MDKADWERALPGPAAEGWAYHLACEPGMPPGIRPGAVGVFDAAGLVAGVPVLRMGYRLETPLQGRLHRIVAGLHLPLELRVLVAGSLYADRCMLALRPGLAPAEREAVLHHLAQALEETAAAQGCVVAGWKDLAPAEAAQLRPVLSRRGYLEIPSLPVAELDLGGCTDLDAYLGTLSRGTRKDIRRKLRSRAAFRIEHRDDIADVAEVIARLYESTRESSEVRYGDLDALPRDYFNAVAAACGPRARHVLYWIGEELVGFNLLLLEPDRVIDKFLGMRYPAGPQHDLYAVSWAENVRFVLASGRRYLQTGQTAYAEKLRFGSRLVPSVIFARAHRLPLRLLLRAAAPWLALDRWDPDLRRRPGSA